MVEQRRERVGLIRAFGSLLALSQMTGLNECFFRFDAAVAAAKTSDAAVVMVGTWSRDQNLREFESHLMPFIHKYLIIRQSVMFL